MSFYRFKNDAGDEYGSFEVYHDDEQGWFWVACFPGCMPDGDAQGPFATEAEAIAAAQENA